MDLTSLTTTALAIFVSVFVAMDPVGALPLVVAWTSDLPPAERNRQLRDALLTALVLGLLFLVAGRWLLVVLGVDVPDFQIAGGVVLLALAVSDLIVGGGHEARGSLPRPDLGVVPIGTPLLAGPATLTTLVVLGDRYGLAVVTLALLVNLLLAWRLFRRASDLTRQLGRNTLRASSKVTSLLLAAIAVKLIREGMAAILHLG